MPKYYCKILTLNKRVHVDLSEKITGIESIVMLVMRKRNMCDLFIVFNFYTTLMSRTYFSSKAAS